MTTFNPQEVLAHYSELSRREDMLLIQIQHASVNAGLGWPELTEEQVQIHKQELELEQEAMRNGYILSVACDSAWRTEDTCSIRPMTPEETQKFLMTNEYPRGRMEAAGTLH